SGWRAAIVGAERLDPGALGRFAAMLAPHGFRREAFLPAYGLAEATLAVSIHPPDSVPRVVRPAWGSLSFAEPVELEGEAELGAAEVGDGAGWLIGCGRSLPEIEVAVLDEDGCALGDGILGELTVRGPTVADGYVGLNEASSTTLAD